MTFARENGILTTVFYGDIYGEGEISAEEITGLCIQTEKVYGGGKSLYKGKIYCFDEASSIKLAVDGDIVSGKTVRQQKIIVSGNEYRINAVRKIYHGGIFHHAEIEVI